MPCDVLDHAVNVSISSPLRLGGEREERARGEGGEREERARGKRGEREGRGRGEGEGGEREGRERGEGGERRMLHAWWCPSVNAFKFQPCDRTSPVTEERFLAQPAHGRIE